MYYFSKNNSFGIKNNDNKYDFCTEVRVVKPFEIPPKNGN